MLTILDLSWHKQEDETSDHDVEVYQIWKVNGFPYYDVIIIIYLFFWKLVFQLVHRVYACS